MKIKHSQFIRTLSVFLAFNMLLNIFLPGISYALTAGPNSPEFSSFTPVSTANMVNTFNGEFSYNLPVVEIPGPDGAGYALSLSYNSNVSSEQESSWVGFGWSLNPGSINRTVRGFPDDYFNQKVTYYNKTRPNWTASYSSRKEMEVFSKDLGFSAARTVRFNNNMGFGFNESFGFSFKGMSLQMNLDEQGATFSGNINPMKIIQGFKKKSEDKAKNNPEANTDTQTTDDKKKGKQPVKFEGVKGFSGAEMGGSFSISAGSNYGLFTFSDAVRATTFSPFDGYSYNWSASLQTNALLAPVGLEVGGNGNFNMQFNKYLSSKPAYGFLYNDAVPSSDHIMMDYYVEKGSSFDKRDYFIGMPFSNFDIFNVSGEGLNGGFRVYPQSLGHFQPDMGESSYKIKQVGVEVMIGTNIGVGLDFGLGKQTTKIDKWEKTPGSSRGTFGQAPSFRFNYDTGGQIEYTGNTNVESGKLKVIPEFALPGSKYVTFTAPGNYALPGKPGSSSFINYNTQAKSRTSGNFNQNIKVPSTLDENLITEFAVVNEGGLNYVYGQPVLTRNETNLMVDVDPAKDLIKDKYVVYKPLKLTSTSNKYAVPSDVLYSNTHHKTVLGEIRDVPYASSYLLSYIATPDYVDADGVNGPSRGDFGGWTRFDYRKVYGDGVGDNSWYRYRTPYQGLLYQQNSVSTGRDDLGTVITGEKEVYFLKTIETKTHVAYFVTNKADFGHEMLKGSQAGRLDGLSAPALTAAGDPAALPASERAKATEARKEQEVLEKIVLLTKDAAGNIVYDKPVKVVRFQYDYSLVPNVANNANSTYNYSTTKDNASTNTGKLTLKKVWFEYNGVVSARISPYEFNYHYKPSSQAQAGKEYFNEYDHLSEAAQNPPYAPELLDPWGSIMRNARERKNQDIPWIDQTPMAADEQFDPAAWQLKSIKLPSGGEIHIQYEQHEYTHVQDRSVMAMARLLNMSGLGYGDEPVCYIDVADLGLDENDPAYNTKLNQLVSKIHDYFLLGDVKKVYFKFLYALAYGAVASLDDCRSDYITGYAGVKSVGVTTYGGKSVIAITLSNEGSEDDERNPIPRQACYDFVSSQRQGKMEETNCINSKYELAFDDLVAEVANRKENGGDPAGDLKQDVVLKAILKLAGDVTDNGVNKDRVCMSVNPQLSFLKLPMLGAKKGGGVRVKRLLMYDKGIESGDAAVYGSEYHYVLEDGITSSGVATNEPSAAREENPLVVFMPKKEQSWFSRITSGHDKEQTEGPLGESLLPAPAVGYARVVTHNIHTGSTGTGFTVNEFYTVKDYPFDKYYNQENQEVKGKGVDMTNLSDQNTKDWLELPLGVLNLRMSKAWMAQGFRFIQNNMHGLPKATAVYGGSYDTEHQHPRDIDKGYVVSSTEQTYFEPGERLKLYSWDAANKTIVVEEGIPGKEMDIAMEARRLKDSNLDFSLEIDISIGLSMFPPIFVSLFPTISMSDSEIGTHSTTKVIRYPVILKSTTVYQDGVSNKQENLAFNKETGNVILTRTSDGFHDELVKDGTTGGTKTHNGHLYNFSLPASWVYPEMGQKAKAIQNTNQLKETAANLVFYQEAPTQDWFKDPAANPLNVLSASVQTYSKNWASSWADERIAQDYGLASNQAAVTALNQLNYHRPKASYVYSAGDEIVSSASKKIYNSGYYKIGKMFDWVAEKNGQPQADKNWIKTNEVLKYSPQGMVLEEENILGIPSAALFGKQYGNFLPVMIAQNARYQSLYFKDFEGEAGSPIAHSGYASMPVSDGGNLISGIKVDSHLKQKGGLAMMWFHFGTATAPESLSLKVNGNEAALKKIAQTGEWVLYEASIKPEQLPAVGAEVNIAISLAGMTNVLVDDVRFQPLEAQATCYVYDRSNYKLLAQFDDRHFGLYYQYDQEGKLVRKIIETERGIKTIQETQYNTPKETR